MTAPAGPHGPSAYRDPHLEHRKAQERAHFDKIADATDPMASLLTIEMNLTELCNRRCVFCPRVDPKVYPNRNLNMSMGLVERVADEILRLGLGCRISFSGYGEPLLHKGFTGIVRTMRAKLPDTVIETNTNGDRLTSAKIRELFDAGLTYLYVNLYDGPEQRGHFEKLFRDAGAKDGAWKLRPHWIGSADDFGLTLNNRSGTVNAPEAAIGPVPEPLAIRCHYPFYKMLVDWNGDVLFCSNDWGREIIVGNLRQKRLDAIWLDPRMLEIRRRLMHGDRKFSPCDKCNVNGTLSGGSSFGILIDHYLKTGEIAESELPADLKTTAP